MKPANLLIAVLCFLALFFGWKTRDALLADPPSADNAGRISAGSRQLRVSFPDPPQASETAMVLAAIAARPLFRPDRLPFRENATSAGRNYDAELSRFQLIGVLTFDGNPTGVVVAKGSPRPERWEVKTGDLLPGFTVKEVQIDGLRLVADGRDFLLPLYAGTPVAGSGPLRTEVTKSSHPQHAPIPRTVSQSIPPAHKVPPQPQSPAPMNVPGRR